jgi:hypothetical protein
MSKKPITWLELIKMKLSEEKSKGNSPSIGDVTPTAKKEWVQIKEGTHPKYIQGKAKTFGRKNKANKSRKANKKSNEDEMEEGTSTSSSKASSSKASSSKASSSKASSSKASSETDIHQLLSEIKLCGKCKKSVDKILKKKGMKGDYNPFYSVIPLQSGAAKQSGGNTTCETCNKSMQNGGCGCTLI